EIKDLRVDLVSTQGESRLWNEFIHRYHYLGYKPLPGAQLRYLGWTQQQREQRLHLVVNNARFLILPWIKSRHLASKVLALTALKPSLK
ncbi:Druantia anti-phage system protein DruA, partial [Bdellovibrionota bacterium FG-2]